MEENLDKKLTQVLAKINSSRMIFWDFDGVIKESVNIKTAAFEKIFRPYGKKIVTAVKQHHEANGGMSRFEKIPLYLEWVGEDVTEDLVGKFCNLFSATVFQSVIDSPWVPGVHEYIIENYLHKYFVLVTATPQNEIENILLALKIDHCFQGVFGSPTKKEDVVQLVLEKQKMMPSLALVVGDSDTDLFAAKVNSVPFLLRKTPLNLHLQDCYEGPQFDDLRYE